MDATVTPMGKRLLRTWMLRPSLDRAEIEGRLDAVEAQVKDTVRREELRRALDGILDLERLLSRVTLETANPRDVLALAASLARIPGASGIWRTLPAGLAARLQRCTLVDELADLREKIDRTLVPEPPLTLERWRSDCPGRGQRSRRTARPEPQLEALPGAESRRASASARGLGR